MFHFIVYHILHVLAITKTFSLLVNLLMTITFILSFTYSNVLWIVMPWRLTWIWWPIQVPASSDLIIFGFLHQFHLILEFLLSIILFLHLFAYTFVVSDFYTVNNSSQWHFRLRNAHSTVVKSALKLCNITFHNKHILDNCHAYFYASPSVTIYTAPFEVVESVLWGPSLFPSSGGYNYYITFVDTFPQYTWIYFLKQKTSPLVAFKQF